MWVQSWRNSGTTEIFFFILSSSLSWCVYLYFIQASLIVCKRKTIILNTKIHFCWNNLNYFFRWEFRFKSLKNPYFLHENSSLPRSQISTSFCDKKYPFLKRLWSLSVVHPWCLIVDIYKGSLSQRIFLFKLKAKSLLSWYKMQFKKSHINLKFISVDKIVSTGHILRRCYWYWCVCSKKIKISLFAHIVLSLFLAVIVNRYR